MNVESALVKQGAQDVDSQRPFFSVVSAVYNVARYLPDFIASLNAQTFNDPPIQIIMVDDGSTDESLVVLQDWAARNPNVTVLTQENAGQGAARNYGLTIAQGQWVNFIDPDDTVPANYFARVAAFIGEHPEVELVSTNRIFYQEKLGRLQDGHPLKWMYADGDVVVDLNVFPRYVNNSAAVSFFRKEKIDGLGLTFDTRIRPNFEDGFFCVQYLLNSPSPLVGYMKTARYIYRKRRDTSSTLQNMVSDPRRYTDMWTYAFLPMLRQAKEKYGYVPDWLQNLMLYELSWYFHAEDSPWASATAARGSVALELQAHLRSMRSYLDDAVIESFDVRGIPSLWRDIWLHGFSDENWVSPRIVLSRQDRVKGELRVLCRYIGERPSVKFTLNGQEVSPSASKVTSRVFFEKSLMNEDIFWVPCQGTLKARINGARAELTSGFGGARRFSVNQENLSGIFTRTPQWKVRAKKRKRLLMSRIENKPDRHLVKHVWAFAKKNIDRRQHFRPARQVIQALAARPKVEKKYKDAWVLMDRIHNANDNAENLFHYLREFRPDINAWFVLQEGTPDWIRLKQAGVDKVVAYGSLSWKLLMMHCVNLISSHNDQPVYRPSAISYLRKPTWNFVFLQHGVTKADLSNWLNSKDLRLIITSTQDEYDSFVKDGSSYVFTKKEVALTGFPRFDQLLKVSQAQSEGDIRTILIAPTWRHWLNQPGVKDSQKRVVTDDFLSTEFVTYWLAFLHSSRLEQIASRYECRIGFLPHPNLQSSLDLLEVPGYVTKMSYDSDVKTILAQTKVLVTDYSSLFFDAAYLERPTVYFQFDYEQVENGGHVGKSGYFDYKRDGFGPVAETVDDALDGLEKLLASITTTNSVPSPYAERLHNAFTCRDGLCSQRVTHAIEALGTMQPASSRYMKIQHRIGNRLTLRSKKSGKEQSPN